MGVEEGAGVGTGVGERVVGADVLGGEVGAGVGANVHGRPESQQLVDVRPGITLDFMKHM